VGLDLPSLLCVRCTVSTEKRYTGLCRLRAPDRRKAPGAAQPAARRASTRPGADNAKNAIAPCHTCGAYIAI
jgi:hypothetical protein